ncbi:hypothetical protein ACQPYH_15255 [Kribbella sp. CA-245084]|uniref:hypothetical protein n=1 Tax=Kribbella sp. CA-245084 TaxID=3239940 RepID=UPI003D913E85
MSVGEFVKDVGPIAIGLGGLFVAYANSRQPGREARHHARVETLYQDMLDTLQHRFNEVRERAGLGEAYALPARDPSTYQVTRARIRLYASGPITASWDKVHSQLTTVEIDQAEGQLEVTMLHLHAIESRIAELAELMRRDLGVPGVPLWTQAWSQVRSSWYVVGGGRRRGIRAARSKHNEGEG